MLFRFTGEVVSVYAKLRMDRNGVDKSLYDFLRAAIDFSTHGTVGHSRRLDRQECDGTTDFLRQVRTYEAQGQCVG